MPVAYGLCRSLTTTTQCRFPDTVALVLASIERIAPARWGSAWQVNPVAVNAVDVFTENKRNVVYLQYVSSALSAC